MNAREETRKLFQHEISEYIPRYGEGLINNVPINGFHERPEGGKGGKDWFGVTWTYAPGDPAPMPSQDYLFTEIKDWREAVVFPDLESFDWEEAAEKDCIDTFDREHHLLSQMIHNGIFERLNSMMGMENAMVAMVTDPEECKAYFEACADYKIRLIEKLHKYYKPDIIVYHDDWGSQKSMLISPQMWRDLIKPATKRICQYTKSLGIIFEMHSDGMIRDIVPELVEDVGVDAIQLMAINDIPALKKITGSKVVYDVFLDTQKYDAQDAAGTLDEKSVREQAHSEFTALVQGGCYIPSFLMLNDNWRDVITDEFEKIRTQINC